MIHYLDNSATTAVSERAAKKALEMMTIKYGNPSSLHRMGIEAETEVEQARERIADALSVPSKNLFFTSGGTEANNTALFGAAEALKRRGNHIVVSAVEHSSVLEAAKELEKRGFTVDFAPVGKDGTVDLDALGQLVGERTVLVSVMAVNNETGTIQPTEKIAKLVHQNTDAFFHVDAVQAFGKIAIKPKKFGADLMSISAHKVHGPKGVGALYIRDGARVAPLLFGGEQQKKQRPGTEAAALIAAFGEAVAEFDFPANREHAEQLRDLTLQGLKTLDGVCLNSPENALPYIVNLSCERIRSETMLHHLESRGVFVSSSSACAKGKRSYVLRAMGLSDDRIDSALRISFSKFNTESDVKALIDGLRSGLNTLQRKRT